VTLERVLSEYNKDLIFLPNILEILLDYAFVSPTFYDTSQSSVIKFSSFIFLPPEVSDSKTRREGEASLSPNISPGGSTNTFVPNIFMTQSQSSVIKFIFFYFFCHLKSVITNLRWMGGINPPNNLVASPQ